MLHSLTKAARAAATLGLTLACLPACLAMAQATEPLTAAQLQKACAETQGGIGSLSVNYSYKDWEGIARTQPTSFAPSRCLTNQVNWTLVFTKSSGASPAFELPIEFTQNSDIYVLQAYPDARACAQSLGDWIISYWKGQGAQFAPSTYDAMRNSATYSQCPSLIKAVTHAVVARINGL